MFRSRPASSPTGPDASDQPVTEFPRRVGFVFWLAWVMANTVGFGALAIADWATHGARPSLPMAELGMGIEEAQAFLRHESPNKTIVYYQVSS